MSTLEQGPAEHDLATLRRQLSDLQATLSALGSGGADAVIMGGDDDDQQVYTLSRSDMTYRVIVEHMGEGAATVSESGVILYANPQLAKFFGVDRVAMVGKDINAYVDEDQRVALDALIEARTDETSRDELMITRSDGTPVPFLVASTTMSVDDVFMRCLVFTDLTMQKQVEQQLAHEAAQIERQRVAHEVNDTIVQGIVAAEMAMDLGELEKAREYVAATSARARSWIGELAGEQGFLPGQSIRSTPARTHEHLP